MLHFCVATRLLVSVSKGLRYLVRCSVAMPLSRVYVKNAAPRECSIACIRLNCQIKLLIYTMRDAFLFQGEPVAYEKQELRIYHQVLDFKNQRRGKKGTHWMEVVAIKIFNVICVDHTVMRRDRPGGLLRNSKARSRNRRNNSRQHSHHASSSQKHPLCQKRPSLRTITVMTLPSSSSCCCVVRGVFGLEFVSNLCMKLTV